MGLQHWLIKEVGFSFYYLFILDVNFLTAGTPGIEIGDAIGLNFEEVINVVNKIKPIF